MLPPIIVNDSFRPDVAGDLSIYKSVEMAEKSFEVYDVGDVDTHIFDSAGRRLRLDLSPDGRVILKYSEDNREYHELVLSIVLEFLKNIGQPEGDVMGKSLEQLVDIAYNISPNPYSYE
jgi:hypothetical protein